MTNNATFSEWEARRATYYAYGGTWGSSYASANKYPGMSTSPPYAALYIGFAKTDPREIVYPNHYRTITERNATYEPTAAEWPEYTLLSRNRYQALAASSGLLVYDKGAGQWVWSNHADLNIPDFNGDGDGCSIDWLTIMFQNYRAETNGDRKLWLIGAVQLNATKTLTNGVAVTGDTISALGLEIDFK